MKKSLIIVLAVLLLAVGALAVINLGDDRKGDAMAGVESSQEPLFAPEETVQQSAPETAQEVEAEAAPEMQAQSAVEDEPAVEIFELAGQVTQLGEGYFILQDAALGEVQVNFGDDTLFEGIEQGDLTVGQTALVLYDGKMTRSLPPQVYALRVGVYAVSGTVTEVTQASVTVVRDELGDEVIVFLPQDALQIAVGDAITAYTNGAMTMSLPGQTTALSIAVK